MDVPAIIGDESGDSWPLTDSRFWAWYKALPPEDRDAFVSFHHGKEPHARFVCALYYLVYVQKRERDIGTITEAFSLATGAIHGEPSTARDAKAAWDLDPVRFLWDRVQRNETNQAKHRIEGLVVAALEKRLIAHLESPDTKDSILRDAMSFLKLVREEEQREREALLDRGVERLKGDAEAQRRAFEAPSDPELVQYFKALVSKIGPNRMADVLEKALPTEASRAT